MRCLLSVLAFAALALALFPSQGGPHPFALAMVLLALGLSLKAQFGRWPPATDAAAHRGVRPMLVLATAVGFAGLLLTREELLFGLGVDLLPFRLGVLFAGVLVFSYAWERAPFPAARFPVLVAAFALIGAWVIHAYPDPRIDVWHFQQDALRLLLAGDNPYAADYENIYGHTRFYGEEVLRDGRIQSCPYPPLSLVLALPGYLLGDVRWSLFTAMATAAVLAVATGRRLGLAAGHPTELAAVAFLFNPAGFTVLERGCTEPFLALAAAACVWALATTWRPARWLALACLLAVKQYGFLWLPALWMSRRLQWWDLLVAGLGAALTMLPFFWWDPAGFWRGVVAFQFHQPFRDDALSVPAAVANLTGVRLSSLFGFVAAGAVAAGILRRASSLPAVVALGGAAVFLAFFVFNKQAFLNYYWFVQTLLALAVVSSSLDAEVETRRGEKK